MHSRYCHSVSLELNSNYLLAVIRCDKRKDAGKKSMCGFKAIECTTVSALSARFISRWHNFELIWLILPWTFIFWKYILSESVYQPLQVVAQCAMHILRRRTSPHYGRSINQTDMKDDKALHHTAHTLYHFILLSRLPQFTSTFNETVFTTSMKHSSCTTKTK